VPQEPLEYRASMAVFDVLARALEELAVLHAARAGHFARATAKAQVDVADGGVFRGQAPRLKGAHYINATAR